MVIAENTPTSEDTLDKSYIITESKNTEDTIILDVFVPNIDPAAYEQEDLEVEDAEDETYEQEELDIDDMDEESSASSTSSSSSSENDYKPKRKEKKPKFKKPQNVRLGIRKPKTDFTRKRKFKYNFKCNQCDVVLHSEHHLTLHVKKHEQSTEKKKLSHICEHCGKAFSAPSTLRAHSVIHTDERPFPCDKCDMRFKNKYGLTCHMETHDDKKYICPICGLALHTNHTYHAHLKIHSDNRKYKCPVCPKAFKRHTPLKVSKIQKQYTFVSIALMDAPYILIAMIVIIYRSIYSVTRTCDRTAVLSVTRPL